ncbi:MAG: hypothetical protein ACPH3M_09730 [Candidatus Puniceispirillales bacterium]
MTKSNEAILSDAGILFEKITDARLMHHHVEATRPDGYDLHRLWQAANGQADDDFLNQISQNFTARRQFKAILSQKANAYQAQQAAASSISDQRSGEDFDVRITPSSSQDGLVYVQLIFHHPITEQNDDMQMLISHCNGIFRQKPLTSAQDQRIQILLHHDDPMLKDLRDPETELYIK